MTKNYLGKVQEQKVIDIKFKKTLQNVNVI